MENHAVAIDPEYAAAIAARFLERDGCDCEYYGPDCPWLAGGHYEYLTGDNSIVYEFPLVNKEGKSGFIIISGSRALPPVLEFCPTGVSLRENLIKCLAGLTELRALRSRTVTWRYFGPLDLVAELELERGGYYYARLPNLLVRETTERLHPRVPMHSGSQDWISARWKYYETENASTGNLPCSKMFGIRPFRYNQTCQSSFDVGGPEALHEGSNYCTPSCIAGCVATAWTVLASAWKEIAPQSVADKIFSDSPDWKGDWLSSWGGPPPPGSQGVNRAMWAAHRHMVTTCGGTTQEHYTIGGCLIFRDYGVNWSWGSRYGVDYAFASGVNKNHQPFLLTAQSVWQPGQPPDGHAIVIHGYNDNDQHLSVCLGWGSSFPDKWIAFSLLSNTDAHFVTQFESKASDIDRADELNTPATFVLKQ